MVNCGMKTISSWDLKQFGSKLEYLELAGMFLEEIDDDLFEFSPNLDVLKLCENRILHISQNTFLLTPKLRSLHLSNNPCIDRGAYDSTEVQEFIKETVQNCPPSSQMHENY
jgi:hypothetical protein